MPRCLACGKQWTGVGTTLPRLRAACGCPGAALGASLSPGAAPIVSKNYFRPVGTCSNNTTPGLWASVSLISSSNWHYTTSFS